MSKRKILTVSFLSCVFVASSLSAQSAYEDSLISSANTLPALSNYTNNWINMYAQGLPSLFFDQDGNSNALLPYIPGNQTVDAQINKLLINNSSLQLLPGFSLLTPQQLQVLGPNITSPSAFIAVTTNLYPIQLNDFLLNMPYANLKGILPSLNSVQMTAVIPHLPEQTLSKVIPNLNASEIASVAPTITGPDQLNLYLSNISQPNQVALISNLQSKGLLDLIDGLNNVPMEQKLIPNLTNAQLVSIAPTITGPGQLNLFLSNISQPNQVALIKNLQSNDWLDLIDGLDNAAMQKQVISNLTNSQLAIVAPLVTDSEHVDLFKGNLLPQQFNSFFSNMQPPFLDAMLSSLSPQQLGMVVPIISAAQIDWGLNYDVSGITKYLSTYLTQDQLQEKITGLLSSPVDDSSGTLNLITDLPTNQSSVVISKLTTGQIASLGQRITTLSQLNLFLGSNLSPSQLKSFVGNIPVQYLGPVVVTANSKDLKTQNLIATKLIPYLTPSQKNWIISDNGGNEPDIMKNQLTSTAPSGMDAKVTTDLTDKDISPAVPPERTMLPMGNESLE